MRDGVGEGPGPEARPPIVDVTSGYAGTVEERRVVNSLLAPVLQVAPEDVPDAATLEALERDFRIVRGRNPLSVALSFGVAPSSNINGGTSAETIWLYIPAFCGYIPTTPVGDALPLSGLRVNGGDDAGA